MVPAQRNNSVTLLRLVAAFFSVIWAYESNLWDNTYYPFW